ncbi:hypothetical protein M885DRAFT_511258 [Pelagophyceae sp. CCMP2097]|nr:hypothetical protein M885DRAFT_511258 [Pelagophyceae sp. CCMP2097]
MRGHYSVAFCSAWVAVRGVAFAASGAAAAGGGAAAGENATGDADADVGLARRRRASGRLSVGDGARTAVFGGSSGGPAEALAEEARASTSSAEAVTHRTQNAERITQAEVRRVCAELRFIEETSAAPSHKGAACAAVLVTGHLSRIFLGLQSLFLLYVGQSSCKVNLFVALSVTAPLDVDLANETTSCLAGLSSVRAFHVADGTRDDAALIVDQHPFISRSPDGSGLVSHLKRDYAGKKGMTLLYQWKRIFEANVLRTRYELESGEDHGVVLYSRADLAYFNGGRSRGAAPKFDICALAPQPRAFLRPPCANWGGMCDQLFAAVAPTMTRIAMLYYHIAAMCERNVHYHPETLLYTLVVQDLRLDPAILQLPTGADEPGWDQAHLNPGCKWSTGGYYIIR